MFPPGNPGSREAFLPSNAPPLNAQPQAALNTLISTLPAPPPPTRLPWMGVEDCCNSSPTLCLCVQRTGGLGVRAGGGGRPGIYSLTLPARSL